MKKQIFVFCVIFSVLILGCKKNSPKHGNPIKIVMSSGQVGEQLEEMQQLVEKFNKLNPDIRAELKDFSGVPQQQLGSINQIFVNKSPELDVIQIDVIWPGDLAKHLIDLNEYKIDTSDFFPAILENNTVKGKLVALPWYIDAGLLYYRKDLLEKYNKTVPTTWQELYSTSKEIQTLERKAGNKDFWGYIWQAGPGEGLTCVAIEYLYSNGINRIVSENRKISYPIKNAVEIITQAKSWLGDITPFDALTFNGAEGARKFWETGNVLFMRNWPYAYNLGNNDSCVIKDLFRIAPLPAGSLGKGASTLGGWQLGVSKYSNHPKEAVRLLQFLTSPEVLIERALNSGYYPPVRSFYNEKTLDLPENSIFSQLFSVLETTVARPSTAASPKYNIFSQVFFTHIHEILSGNVTSVEEGLLDMNKALEAVLETSE